MILLRQVAPFLEHIGPIWLRRWVMKNSPVRNVRRIVQIADVMHERSLEIFQAKRAAIEAGDDTDSKDIMSILCMCPPRQIARVSHTYSASEYGSVG